MNREDFVHSLDVEGYDILDAFENLMTVYSVYSSIDNRYENMKISMTSSELASFDLILDNVDQAKDISNKCSNLIVPLYNKKYNILSSSDNNIVHITLNEQV